jgi:hypothetical protein
MQEQMQLVRQMVYQLRMEYLELLQVAHGQLDLDAQLQAC